MAGIFAILIKILGLITMVFFASIAIGIGYLIATLALDFGWKILVGIMVFFIITYIINIGSSSKSPTLHFQGETFAHEKKQRKKFFGVFFMLLSLGVLIAAAQFFINNHYF